MICAYRKCDVEFMPKHANAHQVFHCTVCAQAESHERRKDGELKRLKVQAIRSRPRRKRKLSLDAETLDAMLLNSSYEAIEHIIKLTK